MTKQKEVTACVHCRQMKVKCNTRESFPAPCTRCEKKGLHCFINPSFKRVLKRGRLDAVERELREVKQRLSSQSTASPSASPSSVESQEDDGPSTPPRLPPTTSPQTGLEIPCTASRTLGNVTLSYHDICCNLDRYYMYYHPHFPIAPPRNTLLQSYDEPILFWVIMMMSSIRESANPYSANELVEEVKNLISTVRAPSAQSLRLIQALLLLCCWPFPFGSTIHDSSWAYCGLAVTYAHVQGLNRADHLSDFMYGTRLNSEEIAERKMTWVACFIISQRLSLVFGFPALIHPDYLIQNVVISSPSWLPQPLCNQLHVAHQSFKFTSLLGHSDLQSTGLLPNPEAVINMFDADLRNQESRLITCWRPEERLYFLATKLHLYSFGMNLVSDEPSEVSHNAFVTAMNLLEIALQATNDIPRWPVYQTRYVIYAIFFLLKLMVCSPSAIDEVRARNMISRTWEVLQRNSCDTDHVSRACEVIKYLSTTEWKESSPLPAPVLSRNTANIPVEMVWRARQRFGEDIRRQRPLDYTLVAAGEALFNDLFSSTFNEFCL